MGYKVLVGIIPEKAGESTETLAAEYAYYQGQGGVDVQQPEMIILSQNICPINVVTARGDFTNVGDQDSAEAVHVFRSASHYGALIPKDYFA